MCVRPGDIVLCYSEIIPEIVAIIQHNIDVFFFFVALSIVFLFVAV